MTHETARQMAIAVYGFGHDSDDLFYKAVWTETDETLAEGKAFSLVCESAGVPDRDTTDADFYRDGRTGNLVQYRESVRSCESAYTIDGKAFEVSRGECWEKAIGDEIESAGFVFRVCANGDGTKWQEVKSAE